MDQLENHALDQATDEDVQQVSFHRIEELENYGISKADISKLKHGGYHTIEAVRCLSALLHLKASSLMKYACRSLFFADCTCNNSQTYRSQRNQRAKDIEVEGNYQGSTVSLAGFPNGIQQTRVHERHHHYLHR